MHQYLYKDLPFSNSTLPFEIKICCAYKVQQAVNIVMQIRSIFFHD